MVKKKKAKRNKKSEVKCKIDFTDYKNCLKAKQLRNIFKSFRSKLECR